MQDRNIILIAVVLLGVIASVTACGEDATPSAPAAGSAAIGAPFRYTLRRPSIQDAPRTAPGEERWRVSLVRNLGHMGDVITFLRVDADLLQDGVRSPGSVFRSTRDPGHFYVAVDNPVIVDFVTGEIGTSGVSGISFHPHPDGRMVVVLLPNGVDVLGVTLSNPKVGSVPWAVTDDLARWTW